MPQASSEGDVMIVPGFEEQPAGRNGPVVPLAGTRHCGNSGRPFKVQENNSWSADGVSSEVQSVASSENVGKTTGTQSGLSAQGPLPGWGVPDSVSSAVIDILSGLWRRGTLSTRDRQLLTVGITAALGASETLPLHVQNGLNGALSKDDIYEVILHVGAYAGFARATDAFKITKDILAAHPSPVVD